MGKAMYKAIIVDDEEIVLRAMEKVIDWGKCGVELCRTCTNAFEAMSAIRELKPELVITDVRMPVMDGIELIRWDREQNNHTEFIVLSGYAEFEFAQNAMREGVKYYLLKPCGEKEIMEVLKQSIKRIEERKNISRAGMDRTGGWGEPEETDGHMDFVDEMMRYSMLHLDNEELSISWLSENLVYRNKDYVGKAFAKKAGESYSTWITKRRIERAKQLIQTMGEKRLYMVAEKSGFGNNPQYFSTIFKKYTGYTPKEYKKKTREISDL